VIPVDRRQSLWLPCLEVESIDAALESLARAGGSLAADPAAADDRYPTVVDSTGASFCLTVQPGVATGEVHAGAAIPGRFCWNELSTADPDRAAAFYHAVAGWTHAEWDLVEEGRYWLFRRGGRDVAGMMEVPDGRGPSYWVPYVQVESAEATAALAVDLGATVVVEPRDVPGGGRYAAVRDPAGALIAVFALTVAA
jgi:uncharacterized protein